MESPLNTDRRSSPDKPDKSYEPVAEADEVDGDRVTESNEELSDESQEKLIDHFEFESIAPDGGWGWVVCFGSFLINVIVDGTVFSFGILLIDLLDFFQESRAKTAWVGSTLLGMSMVMGPVVSFLLKFFSCRQMVISGTLLSVSSFVISVFSPNVEMLILTYGFIAGIGMGMIFIPAIIIVGLYFNKKRAIATGIATSGAGVGVFVYGYLCDYLLEEYDWRGTILILSGLLLNCVVCGILFRPIVEQKLKKRLRYLKEHEALKEELQLKNACNGSVKKTDLPSASINDSMEKFDLAIKTNNKVIKSMQNSEKPLKVNGAVRAEYENSLYNTSQHCNQVSSRLYKSAQHLSHVCDQDLNVSPRLLSTSCHLITDKAQQSRPSDSNSAMLHIQHGLLRPMLRKDIYYSGSVQQLPDYKHCGNLASFLARMTRESSETQSESFSVPKLRSCWDKLMEKTNLWLFKDPIFVLLLIVFSMWTVQSVTLTYFPDMAVSKDIHRSQAAILISIVGITNTLGRVIAGFFHDVLHVQGIVLYIGSLFFAAAVNFAIPHFFAFSWLAASAGVFGFCMAIAVSMRTIVLTEQLGIEQLTASFGLVAFVQGITFMLDPPIAGQLYAIDQSYTLPYMMAGAMYLLSCICSVIISCITRHRNRPSTDVIITVESNESDDVRKEKA